MTVFNAAILTHDLVHPPTRKQHCAMRLKFCCIVFSDHGIKNINCCVNHYKTEDKTNENQLVKSLS